MKNIKLSALNLVPIREGQEDKDAINDMVTLCLLYTSDAADE